MKLSFPDPPAKLDFSVPAVMESLPAPPVTLIVAVLFSFDTNVKAADVLVKADALTVIEPVLSVTIPLFVVIPMELVVAATMVIVSKAETVEPNVAAPESAVKLNTSPVLVPPTNESSVVIEAAAAEIVKAAAEAEAEILSLPVFNTTSIALVNPAPTVTASAPDPLPVMRVRPEAFARAPRVIVCAALAVPSVRNSTPVTFVKSESITVDASEIVMVSLPTPPATVSLKVKLAEVMVMLSLPCPPVNMSLPAEPVKLSLPDPPVRVPATVNAAVKLPVKLAASIFVATAAPANVKLFEPVIFTVVALPAVNVIEFAFTPRELILIVSTPSIVSVPPVTFVRVNPTESVVPATAAVV